MGRDWERGNEGWRERERERGTPMGEVSFNTTEEPVKRVCESAVWQNRLDVSHSVPGHMQISQ